MPALRNNISSMPSGARGVSSPLFQRRGAVAGAGNREFSGSFPDCVFCVGHGSLTQQNYVRLLCCLFRFFCQKGFKSGLIRAEGVYQTIDQGDFPAHFPGDPPQRIFGRFQRRRKSGQYGDAAAVAHCVPAHLFINADNGDADISGQILDSVRGLSHRRADI